MSSGTPRKPGVPGLLLENVASHPIYLGNCREGYANVIINCGFKLGREHEGFYILFENLSQRKKFRQSSSWLMESKKKFKIAAKSVEHDPEDCVIVPYNSYTEQVRNMKKIGCELNFQQKVQMHEMAIDQIRSSLSEDSKTILVDLLVSSPLIQESEKTRNIKEASKIMREIDSDGTLKPPDLILRFLHLACQCYHIGEFSEVKLHLNSIDALMKVDGRWNVEFTKQFRDLLSQTVERIRKLCGTEGGNELRTEEKYKDILTFPTFCDTEQNSSQLIIGEIVEVSQSNSMILQPLGRRKCLVQFEESEVYNNNGERLTSFPPGDPSNFFVTLNFKDKKIFLIESEMLAEPQVDQGEDPPSRSVFFNSMVEVLDYSSEEETIFLSQPSHEVPVDVEDEDDEDELFQELENYIFENLRLESKGKGNVEADKLRATSATDLWRTNSSWFLTFVKFLQNSSTEVQDEQIRESVNENCSFKVRISNINREKLITLTSNFIFLKVWAWKMGFTRKQTEDLPPLKEKIVDVDDEDEDVVVEKAEVNITLQKDVAEDMSELLLLIESYELKLMESNETITNLTNENTDLKNNLMEKVKDISIIKETSEERKKILLDVIATNEDMQIELSTKNEQIQTYERLEKAKDAEINSLKRQLEELKARKKMITLVAPNTGQHFYLHSNSENLLALTAVRRIWPAVTSLSYSKVITPGSTALTVILMLRNGFFYPPAEGWGNIKYQIL